MRLLLAHPGPLMYSEVYVRLEPLGLELAGAAARRAGHEVRLLDLQTSTRRHYTGLLRAWRPDAVGFSLNYLANVPEVINLAKECRRELPRCFVFAGGHSASFIPGSILGHSRGAIDCIVRGEAEEITPGLLEAAAQDRSRLHRLAGVTTVYGAGPNPGPVASLDTFPPARDLLPNRRRYFIGTLDPCASIEFTRGCPWDCVFCSAWTFYGRTYRTVSPEVVVDELKRIREPGVFIVDDVAFIDPAHGEAIGRAVEGRRIRKSYYLETRTDVLLRNREVFRFWKRLGLEYMFLGFESPEEEQLKRHRKRVTAAKNLQALEFARSLGIAVAINIIAEPHWDERDFTAVREWALAVPEIVHLTVNTPYPGTETWNTDFPQLTTRDYRLFDVQHAVVPTRLPLHRFYQELVRTQSVLYRKHLGWRSVQEALAMHAGNLLRGQTNFLRMLWKFGSVFNAERQAADHRRRPEYEIGLPNGAGAELSYVLRPAKRGLASQSTLPRGGQATLSQAKRADSAACPPAPSHPLQSTP